MNISLMVCRCAAGRASDDHTHSGEDQALGSRLVCCTHVAAVGWDGCRCVSLGSGRVSVRKQRETQVPGVSKYKYVLDKSQ